jgi:hypothetical protein
LPNTYLTKNEIYPVSVLIHWANGEKEPCCLATNLPDRTLTLRYYKRRMWIEEMLGDMKGHGFDLESTMLRHFSRLSRLTLAVAFLYVWLRSNGSKFIRAGLRHLVDRKDRRDLSLFQIGFRLLDRKLLNSLPVSPKRRDELERLFEKCKASKKYVTAFLDFATYTKYADSIAWETEVWTAEMPSHLIHFNSHKFLGPR